MRFIILTVAFLNTAHSANILGLFPFPTKSHFIMFDSLMSELAARGHNVTMVSPYPKSQKMVNFTDISLQYCVNLPSENMTTDGMYQFRDPLQILRFVVYDRYDKNIFRCKSFTDFLQQQNSFDLIITEVFFSDLLLRLVPKYDVPFITFCASHLFPWAADTVGNPDNPSYLSYTQSDMPLDENSSFYQRLYNTFLGTISRLYYELQYSFSDQMALEYFGPGIPIKQIAKNVSVIFTFSHFSTMPRPLLPNVIEVGGLHLKKAKPLNQELMKFIDDSPAGVIYFCFGSIVNQETLPEAKKNAFLNAFAQLPYRILWKGKDYELSKKYKNILVSEWFPQRDILAHPKVKLFITHGGQLGLSETVFEGVPIFGVPFYGDQLLNLKLIQARGAGEYLEYTEINNETVLAKLQQVLNDKSYGENMKKLSSVYTDRPMSPLDLAIYWVEYVIRHKGAPHLRSAAADLPLYKYLLLDVIIFLVACLCSLCCLLYYFTKIICQFLITVKKAPSKTKSSKKRN